MFPFITPEMIEAALGEQKAKVAALTPEERLWLAGEADWRYSEARRAEEAKHQMHRELRQLLDDDIEEFGCPSL
jgi:hypothetical protein